MATSSEALPRPRIAAPKNTAKFAERMFFSGMAIALVATVFAGFSPTFYLRDADTTPLMTPSLLAHGVAFSAWMVLLLVQTSLIAADKVALHRTLGVAGAALGVVMMVLGVYVAVSRTRDGLSLTPPGISPLAFLAIPLATPAVFAPLLAAALWMRRRPDHHKRLILIATLELVTAAIARFPGMNVPIGDFGPLGPVGFFGVTDLFLIAMVVYDWRSRGRIHPATLWGAAFLIASQPLRLAIGFTSAWQAFAGWLTS